MIRKLTTAISQLHTTNNKKNILRTITTTTMKHHPYVHYLLNNNKNPTNTQEFNYSVNEYSCLSEYVSALVVHRSLLEQEETTATQQPLVDEQGLLLWQNLYDYNHFHEQHPDEEDTIERDVLTYQHAAQYVKQVSVNVHTQMNDNSCTELLAMNLELLTLLNLSHDRHLHLFQNEEDLLLQFTVFSTYVERLIASVYKNVRIYKYGDAEENVVVPATLSEILATTELLEVLDPKMIFFITAFMGRPTGLNLRNIAWHGFIEHDGHLRKSYVFLLVSLYLSLCKRVVDWCESNEHTFLWKTWFVQTDTYYSQLYKPWAGESFNIDQVDIQQFSKEAADIISRSYFVPPPRKFVGHQIIQLFEQAVLATDQEERNMYLHYTLALLFPHMEHMLRIVFVSVNDVPENMLKAESRQLFSTIDILLNPLLDGDWIDEAAPKEQNNIGRVLGEDVTDALLDLFIQYQGPRLRDKVAHNEVAVFNINLVLHFLVVYLYITRKLTNDVNVAISNPTLLQAFDYLGKSNAVFDVRTRFIAEWNNFVDDIYILPSEMVHSWTSVKESEEHYSTFSKAGYSLKKLKDDTIPANRSDCVTLINHQLSEKSKVVKKDMIDFTSNEILEFLENKVKLIDDSSSWKISTSYRDHFYATSQHISNVSICKKILEELLIPSRTLLREKIQNLVESIQNRTARTAHRKSFATIYHCIQLFNTTYLILALQLKQLYLEMQTSGNSDTVDKQVHTSLMKLLTVSERYYNSILDGSYGVLICRVVTFLCNSR
jgi:hypothetical protein